VLNSHNINTLWSTGITDSTITVTAPGLYQETLSNICGSATDTVNVTQYPDIAGLDMTDSRDYLCESVRDSVMITASIDSSGQRPVTFTWSTGISDSSAYSSGIIIYEAGTYQVVAYNGYCPVMKTISIDSMSCDSECISGVAIPDIFSPNGDMKNDTFYILHLCDIVPFDMHIYDRWGELVFESPDINKGWDGNYRGSPQPQGVYWLWLALTLSDGKTVFKSGTVTLVR
jgi:gliding motility-associated-like protein